MSGVTHTPGPWMVDKNYPGIVRINNDPTCGILVGQAANAHLVATAPELLEMVQKLLIRIGEHAMGVGLSDYAIPVNDPVLVKAREVIRKAKGLQNDK